MSVYIVSLLNVAARTSQYAIRAACAGDVVASLARCEV